LRKVLIVDDEKSIRELLSLVVGQFLNCEFELSENSSDAIEKVRTKEFDLIIMDVFMPPTDWIETLQSLKKIKPEIPIIVMTDFRNLPVEQEVLQHGADKVLKKPFSLKHMIDSAGSFVLT